MPVERYVALWTPPVGDTKFDPPNADLEVLGTDGAIDAVVVLKSVSGDSAELTFEIQLIEGTLPGATFGPVVLFVDVCDPTYPLCPPL